MGTLFVLLWCNFTFGIFDGWSISLDFEVFRECGGMGYQHILFWIFPLVKSTTCHNPKRVVVLTMVTQAKTAKVWSSFGCDHSQSQPQIMTSF